MNSSESTSKHPYRTLKTNKQLKKTMTRHYREVKFLPYLRKKTAWITSGFPVELVLAMDFLPVYPENYGALCGASKAGVRLCETAEKHGYSTDLCSYARNSIGSIVAPKQSPMRGLSKPSVLLACNNICGTCIPWFKAAAEMHGRPFFPLDTPFVEGTQQPHHLEYVESQLHDMIAFLEKASGKKFRPDKLAIVAQRSSETAAAWTRILDSCKNHPSPLNGPDRFLAMAPIVSLRGTTRALSYYNALELEVSDRVKEGIGAIREEKIRLLWDNIATWTFIRLFRVLAQRGVVFPVDSYTYAWTSDLSAEGKLIPELARLYSNIYLNIPMDKKRDFMIQLIRDFKLDGFVLHSNQSCKRYSLGQYILKNEIQEETGVPGLIIDGDMVDSRKFSEDTILRQFEAYIELLS